MSRTNWLISRALNALEAMDDIYEGYDCVDDVSNRLLARRLEIDFLKKMKVYDQVHRSFAAGKKVISTRWLDINKGDSERLDYRARLVGRELRLNDHRLDLFAATPPLESLRLLCSICASNQRRARPYRILAIDVKRAYCYAPARRGIFIEFLLEEWDDEGLLATADYD